MIWGGADAIKIEIKRTINVNALESSPNYPHPSTPPHQSAEKLSSVRTSPWCQNAGGRGCRAVCPPYFAVGDHQSRPMLRGTVVKEWPRDSALEPQETALKFLPAVASCWLPLWLLPPRSGRMVIPGEIVCLYKEKSLAMWFPVYFYQSPRFQHCSPRQQWQPPRTQMPLVFPSKREGILPAASAKPKSQNHGFITPSRACGKGSFPFGCFSAGVVYTPQ